jgi:hypothetical protein
MGPFADSCNPARRARKGSEDVPLRLPYRQAFNVTSSHTMTDSQRTGLITAFAVVRLRSWFASHEV